VFKKIIYEIKWLLRWKWKLIGYDMCADEHRNHEIWENLVTKEIIYNKFWY
jgi:hypothetical protein